jgi:hypothetical protein
MVIVVFSGISVRIVFIWIVSMFYCAFRFSFREFLDNHVDDVSSIMMMDVGVLFL